MSAYFSYSDATPQSDALMALPRGAFNAPDLDNLPIRDRHVHMSTRRAGSVDDEAVFDQKVVRHGRSFVRPSQTANDNYCER